MNDYRNFQQHRYNKHFSKYKHVKKKRHGKNKHMTKTQFATQDDHTEAQCLRLQQEFFRYIELIDNLNINNPQEYFKTNHNEYDLAFIKAIVIDIINKYSTFDFFQNINLDIWRYIVNENFLYPHEIYGTLLLINKYFNQLFDKKWLLNKLSNKQSLILYYKGLRSLFSQIYSKYPFHFDFFCESMIHIIDKLYEMKDDLKSINSLCNCVNSSDWIHMHHNCHHDDKFCNNKTESGNLSTSNGSNFAGLAFRIGDSFPRLNFLQCVCSDNTIDVKNDMKVLRHLRRHLNDSFAKFLFGDELQVIFSDKMTNCDIMTQNISGNIINCSILNDLRKIYQWRSATVLNNSNCMCNEYLEKYSKRINDSLLLLTLWYYPPMKDNLLLVALYNHQKFDDSLFSKNMNGKWDYYVNKWFNSEISIDRPRYLYLHDWYFKSIKAAHNGTLILNKDKMEDSKNDLIYANIDNCGHESRSQCELILKSCDDFEGN